MFTCGTKTNNDMIMEYVRNMYEEYNIPDPLRNRKKVMIEEKEPLTFREI